MTHILLPEDICHAEQPKIVEVSEVALPVTRCYPGIENVAERRATAAATVRWLGVGDWVSMFRVSFKGAVDT